MSRAWPEASEGAAGPGERGRSGRKRSSSDGSQREEGRYIDERDGISSPLLSGSPLSLPRTQQQQDGKEQSINQQQRNGRQAERQAPRSERQRVPHLRRPRMSLDRRSTSALLAACQRSFAEFSPGQLAMAAYGVLLLGIRPGQAWLHALLSASTSLGSRRDDRGGHDGLGPAPVRTGTGSMSVRTGTESGPAETGLGLFTDRELSLLLNAAARLGDSWPSAQWVEAAVQEVGRRAGRLQPDALLGTLLGLAALAGSGSGSGSSEPDHDSEAGGSGSGSGSGAPDRDHSEAECTQAQASPAGEAALLDSPEWLASFVSRSATGLSAMAPWQLELAYSAAAGWRAELAGVWGPNFQLVLAAHGQRELRSQLQTERVGGAVGRGAGGKDPPYSRAEPASPKSLVMSSLADAVVDPEQLQQQLQQQQQPVFAPAAMAGPMVALLCSAAAFGLRPPPSFMAVLQRASYAARCVLSPLSPVLTSPSPTLSLPYTHTLP